MEFIIRLVRSAHHYSLVEMKGQYGPLSNDSVPRTTIVFWLLLGQ